MDPTNEYRPVSPDLSGLPSPQFGHRHTRSRDHLGASLGHNTFTYQATPTSFPPQYQEPQEFDMAGSRYKTEDDDDYLPDAAAPRQGHRVPRSRQQPFGHDPAVFDHRTSLAPPMQGIPTQPPDPTLGVQLKTSFPVARIKRIMQADEDIGKVAQVTPHVVSRALELFMIKLISASAAQAQGPAPVAAAGASKGPRRIQAQHMKRAIASDETFDFLQDIIAKVPDAPLKGKKETGSDSEEGTSSSKAPKKPRKKRKDSGDDF